MNHVNASMSWDFLASILEEQLPDGMLSIDMEPRGPGDSLLTQPPVLAWGIRTVFDQTKDVSMLASAYAGLEAYLEWDMANRDIDDNSLLEWLVKNQTHCHCAESGMDNSPRFDAGRPVDR